MTLQDVPDYLRPGLKLVIVGINPGARSGATGHHYAWPGNHFWPVLYEARVIPEPLTYADDRRVLEWAIGLTNLCHRTTRSADELTPEELGEGAAALRSKLLLFRPKVVCFNGKGIYEAFSGRRQVAMGLQAERLEDMPMFVAPSSSARTAAYQRAAKVEYFRQLKRIVDDCVAAREAGAIQAGSSAPPLEPRQPPALAQAEVVG
jgi:mismatch-specific thymine-DNA glycosylase